MKTAGNVLVDTSVGVAYFRGEQDLRHRFNGIIPVCVPWVVLGELHFGAQRAQRRQQELSYVRDLLAYVEVLFADRETPEVYGEVKAELASIGKLIPENDIMRFQFLRQWIAAMARQYDLPLATRDGQFDHVLRLTTPAW